MSTGGYVGTSNWLLHMQLLWSGGGFVHLQNDAGLLLMIWSLFKTVCRSAESQVKHFRLFNILA